MISYMTLHPPSLTVLSLRAEGSPQMFGIFNELSSHKEMDAVDVSLWIWTNLF